LDSDISKESYQSDYDPESANIVPVANPNEVSDSQKLTKAQILFSLRGQGLNDQVIMKRFVDAMQIPDANELFENIPPAPPDPEIVLEGSKLELEGAKHEFELIKYVDEQAKIHSEIILNIAKAEAEEAGPQLEEYKTQLQALIGMAKDRTTQMKQTGGQQNENQQG